MIEDRQQPIHISSSLTSLVSQATLTDIQENNNNTLHSIDKQQLHSLYVAADINDIEREHEDEGVSPTSVDLSSLWEPINPLPHLPSLKRKKNKSALKRSFSNHNNNINNNNLYEHSILPLPAMIPTQEDHHLYNNHKIVDDDDDDAIYIHLDEEKRVASLHEQPSLEIKKKVICILGKSLINDGCPGYRVESVLIHCTKLLGLEASFTFLPDAILVTFIDDGYRMESMIVKTSIAFDTGKIGLTNKIINDFLKQVNQNNEEDPKHKEKEKNKKRKNSNIDQSLSSLPPPQKQKQHKKKNQSIMIIHLKWKIV
ncbi:unnamed protein product [Cunninghamella echinulata]